jgi:hypothetical protein
MGATQYRIFRSFFSPPFSAAADDFTGTTAIPHMGHAPGWSVTMKGCMGQVYFFSSCMAPIGPSPAGACILFITQ